MLFLLRAKAIGLFRLQNYLSWPTFVYLSQFFNACIKRRFFLQNYTDWETKI